MLRDSTTSRFLAVFSLALMAVVFAAGPAAAKKHAEDTSSKGGLYIPPQATEKPAMVLDTSMPKVPDRPGDALREASPPPAEQAAQAPAAQKTRSIESMRLHSLFE